MTANCPPSLGSISFLIPFRGSLSYALGNPRAHRLPLFSCPNRPSKILYGILLDRMSLSAKNKCLDKEGRVYIIFTVEDIMAAMGCGNQKAGWCLSELEKKADLIERKRQGLGKPNLIYVKRFLPSPASHIQKCENNTSVNVKSTPHERLKSHGNKTEIKQG